MKIIPAIDIIDGKCVRLSQGDYTQKTVYFENPVDTAKQFEAAGFSHLHVVDLDGAKAGQVINWKTIESITKNTTLAIDVGGGIKTTDELQRLLDLGVKQVNLGSIAVKQPELVYTWIDLFGADKIILSADVKNEYIAIHGWQETSSLSLIDFVKQYQQQGIRYITCTDIQTDGMLAGPNIQLYKKLTTEFPDCHIIASGGVHALTDLDNLNNTLVYGVIIGKAFYENKLGLNEVAAWEKQNQPV